MEVIDYVTDMIAWNVVTPEMVCTKILAGEKFGPLDINKINLGGEALEEIIDLFAYRSGLDLQDGPQ